MKNRKSFTLMELLVVITIIAVLAAVSIPQVIGVIQRAQDAAIRMNMRVMLTEATRISILEGDLSRIHCNTGGHPDILAICETVRAQSPHPAQLRSFATARTFCIQVPLHDGTFWRVDHRGFAGRDLCGYIARWDMDEGSDQVVGDATGTNPGTRGPTIAVEPQDPTWAVGHLTFDGTNDFVAINTVPDSVFHGNFTVEAWTNFSVVNRGIDNTILTHGSTVANGGLHLVERGSRAYFGFWGNDTPGTTVLSAETWHHIVFVYDGRQKIYVNGQLDASRAAIAYIGTGLNARIGPQPWAPGHVVAGFIDNVRIYNRALTAEEVRVSFLRGR